MPIIEDARRYLAERGDTLSDAVHDRLRWQALLEMNHRSVSGNAVLALAFLFIAMSSDLSQTHTALFYVLFSLVALSITARMVVMVSITRNAEAIRLAWEGRLYLAVLSFAITWGILTATMLGIYGISWAALIVVLFAAGMGAGALATFCLWRSLVVAYLLVLFVPSIFVSISVAGTEGYILALGLTLYMAYLLIQVGFWNREYWSSRINNELLAIRAVELQKARELSEAANRAKSEFLSSMSHELRTPLNGILGFAQLLEYDRNTPLTPKQKGQTEHIIKCGQHLLELIDQVLELSKIETGKVNMSIEDVPLDSLLDECVPLVMTMAEARGITLDHERSQYEEVVVRADRTRLKQVLLNLLSNAVKYNREGGSISLDARSDGGMVHIAIIDTGLGITEARQAKLFQPFERLGHEASDIKGTGIGLTITRQLIHLMDGEVGFESEAGKGSTFWIEVPLAKQGAENHHDQLCSGSADEQGDTRFLVGDAGKDYVALYVEDNPANLMLMENIVALVPNLELITTHTAELGVEMAIAQHPDIILMDINLPGMSGVEALGQIRKRESTADIPVIAVTAAAMPHQIEEGMEQGFLSYVTKPIQVETLLQTMQEALKSA